MKIIVLYESKNIAPRFSRAIWRKYQVLETFASAKVAKKYHNLKNCHYKYIKYDSEGNLIVLREINNSKIGTYGNRM